jgi:NAD-dependent deacetylase
MATIEAWKKNPEMVLNFIMSVDDNYLMLNLMVLIGQIGLEEDFDVTIITQNVDDLHERAVSTNILHLHGELTKAKSSYGTGNRNFDTVCEPINIGYDDILYVI